MTEAELETIVERCEVNDRDEEKGFRDQMMNLSDDCRALIAEVRSLQQQLYWARNDI